MHINNFRIAKKFLEEKLGVFVVGGYISPSHDDYVFRKLGDEAIPIKERVRMCEIVCEKEGWLDVSTWECAQDDFEDFPEVIMHHKIVLSSNFPEFPFELYYVCGSDLAVHSGLGKCRHGIRTICVKRRAETDLLLEKELKRAQKGYFYVVETDYHIPVSSTEIRKRIRNQQPLDDLMDKDASDYLVGLFQAKKLT
eukprot:TRINITY_DN1252_c0_g1_i2.p1 TRINITY_DN1252_c0_g1~~TRINITY_DN1252_c0_g1_i2.p1  ORF type:complete len:196 (-),score=41.95 TRINITY_DN1252_c0_g1_i2:117-704(-)